LAAVFEFLLFLEAAVPALPAVFPLLAVAVFARLEDLCAVFDFVDFLV
jgi:hypothetical protein